jgi:hypothetical protein
LDACRKRPEPALDWVRQPVQSRAKRGEVWPEHWPGPVLALPLVELLEEWPGLAQAVPLVELSGLLSE